LNKKEKLMNSVANYPGIPAVFEHTKGDWSCYDSGGELCRELAFESIVKDSLIKGFSLFGYKDRSVSIRIDFGNDTELFKIFVKHLQTHQVSESTMDHRQCTIFTIFHKDLKAVFRILTQNNQIPAQYLKQIESIVEKGSCEPWQKPEERPTRIHRNNLKNREFDKEAAQILESGVSDIVQEKGASEDPKFVAKPTPSKTDSSGCFGIAGNDERISFAGGWSYIGFGI